MTIEHSKKDKCPRPPSIPRQIISYFEKNAGRFITVKELWECLYPSHYNPTEDRNCLAAQMSYTRRIIGSNPMFLRVGSNTLDGYLYPTEPPEEGDRILLEGYSEFKETDFSRIPKSVDVAYTRLLLDHGRAYLGNSKYGVNRLEMFSPIETKLILALAERWNCLVPVPLLRCIIWGDNSVYYSPSYEKLNLQVVVNHVRHKLHHNFMIIQQKDVGYGITRSQSTREPNCE